MSENSADIEVQRTDGSLIAPDGLRLFHQAWKIDSPRALMVIHHGYGEHSSRYEGLARLLNQNGYSVFAQDARGHGQSGGRRAHVDRFSHYISDLQMAIEHARDEIVTEKVFLIGHSLGGLISAKFAIEKGDLIDGLVLSSPLLGLALKVPALKEIAGRMVSRIWPTLTMSNEINSSHLTHDSKCVEDYDNDPLVNKVTTARWFTETMAAVDEAFETARFLSVPVLFTIAGGDKIVSADAGKKFYERCGSLDKTLQEWPGMYHEVFHELDNEEVLEKLLAWLGERI